MRQFAVLLFVFATVQTAAAEKPKPVNGDAVIRAKVGPSDLVITTTDRLAGAIHSLTWNGKEFIDSLDHGRQLQSACSFDCDLKQPFWAECYNPTEAGSRKDGAGPKSSSRLLKIRAEKNELETRTQMAFWLLPTEESSRHPSLNKTVLSEHIVSKKVHIGYKDLPHAIVYDVTFTVPKGEKHTFGQFEAVTGYMPAEFVKFWKFVPTSGKLEELSDGPGEQDYPVVLATEDGKFAMGVFSPDQPSKAFEKAGYGRFRFGPEKVTKWNCVFRVRAPEGLATGDYHYRCFVAVGTLEDVRTTLAALVKEFEKR